MYIVKKPPKRMFVQNIHMFNVDEIDYRGTNIESDTGYGIDATGSGVGGIVRLGYAYQSPYPWCNVGTGDASHPPPADLAVIFVDVSSFLLTLFQSTLFPSSSFFSSFIFFVENHFFLLFFIRHHFCNPPRFDTSKI
jgi:hypothetical protein